MRRYRTHSCRSSSHLALRAREGFSLIELLVVIAILATLGGVAVYSLDGLKEQADVSIARAEMAELKKALLQFQADMGHLPGQGPLGLSDGTEDSQGQVDLGVLRLQLGDYALTMTDAEVGDIFTSPACFLQLFKEPMGAIDPSTGLPSPVVEQDPVSRRGWRGPYLHGSEEGYVAVPVFAGLEFWDPMTGDPIAAWIPAVLDPFVQDRAVDDPRYAVSIGPPSGGRILTRAGRPYFLFYLGDPERARIVTTGPNGRLRRLDGTLESGTLLYTPEVFLPGDDNASILLLR